MRDALGADDKFLPIVNDHPLYHSFFDFSDGSPQGSDIGYIELVEEFSPASVNKSRKLSKSVHYLEGIWLDERLVAIYSDKGYVVNWTQMSNNDPQLKMGVNMVVFALIQEGSIAQQKMDFFSTTQ